MTAFARTPVRTMRGMSAAVRMYLMIASQYRVNLSIWLIVSVLQAVIYLSVWQAVAAANGGSTGGFTPDEFAGYYLVLLVIQQFVTTVSITGEFSGYVRRGTLSILLLRPLHPFAYVLGGMLGFRVQFLLLLPPVILTLSLAFDPELLVRPLAALAMLLLLPLALLTKVMGDTILACSAMWLTRIDGSRGMYGLLILLMSGHLAPLALLPDAMQAIAKVLPFYWMLGFPTELLIGRAPLSQVWVAIAVLGAWSIALYVILQPLWRAGTRAYEAVGS